MGLGTLWEHHLFYGESVHVHGIDATSDDFYTVG